MQAVDVLGDDRYPNARRLSGGDRPMESLSLNFTKITYNNIGMGAANETGQPDRAEWDLSAGKGS